MESEKEKLEDLNKRIRIIKQMKEIVGKEYGQSVSYDTEILVMQDYCDYLVEELEKAKRPIVAELEADIKTRQEELEQLAKGVE